MLASIGLLAIVSLFLLILSKRLSPLVALIVVPIVASLLAGFGMQTTEFVIHGIKNIGPVVGIFIFAIIFFGVMTDAGLLDPVIKRILRAVGGNCGTLSAGVFTGIMGESGMLKAMAESLWCSTCRTSMPSICPSSSGCCPCP